MITTEKKVGHYQEHKYGLNGPWESVDYYKISAVDKSKQTIIKSPLPVTLSTLSQFSDFDLRWYSEKKVGHYQEYKCGLYGPWKSAAYDKIYAVSKSKQTIKSPLPVTFSTHSQFSDFDLRWYSEKKVGHYQEHKCGLYGPWKSADYEQLILDPYEYHFPGAGYLLAVLYCSLHLQRAAEKSTTQTRQEHQSTGNILTRYILENTDLSYIWTK